ncbi:MAG TPA: peptidylprolyl isomerase [Gemmatimonadaceae bacterium]|nr:peptidylprolyl isomerase [Gemmatimonadaceae bacterium]
MQLLILTLLAAPTLAAQTPSLTRADSQLVHAILTAEDRRDASDASLVRGLNHRDERVRMLARRAQGRIRDTLFTDRYWLPATPARVWSENPWRGRYRAMAPYRDACDVIALGLRDSTWQVRLRAADVARASCANDDRIVGTLNAWIDSLPGDVARRAANGVSWHPAAHALVALARLRPGDARRRIPALASHAQWHLRLYAARAAGIVTDTATLRTLARDPNDNVKEAAIENLSRIGGHAFDDVYLAALDAQGAQAVRAAAIALKGSQRPDAKVKANAMFERWVARANESERDARMALLEAAGRPVSDDRPMVVVGDSADRIRRVPASAAIRRVPPQAVALALGADIRLRVEMSPASGGGAFVVKLRGDLAPIMAARILLLARSGYYENGTWHRVEHDFVVQGGAHGDNEYVGHASFLRDELATLAHPRGTVGMSTRGHDSGDFQWFINMRDNPRLIRDFTIFGEVVEGMDVVDQIQEGDAIQRITILEAPGRPAGRS